MPIREQIVKILNESDIKGEIALTAPPNPELGDLALACFGLAKEKKKNPMEVAKELAGKIKVEGLLAKVEATGPYINFYLNSQKLAELVLSEMAAKDFGKSDLGTGRKVMVEFAHPNTHKAFHIGHLRNIITGESIVRILANASYQVIRANYQGDVGMHIAKCLYGILQIQNSKTEIAKRVKFLGEAYASGSKAFEADERAKEEIADINEKIYSQDESIKEIYQTTRQWSLDYFDHIYQRLDTHFDRLYFESEVFAKGKEIVLKFLDKGVFKKSQGAIIFAGSKYGLHDRVFINSKGFPTYEAKDMRLAEMQFGEYNPEKIIHVVGKEQAEYFKVIFKALEFTLPQSQGKEYHLNYGWVTLKEGKMSSRTGQVILGEWLLDEVAKKVNEIMRESELNKKEKEEVVKAVALAAVKYAFLKTGVKNDIKFDFEESVSLNGDSGPYLLYIVARIQSILRKSETLNSKSKTNPKFKIPNVIDVSEKKLLLRLSEFPEVAEKSAIEYDPSKIARYLFELAQNFNGFYDQCPVLSASAEVKIFRLQLIKAVENVMVKGLNLLGISPVERM